MAFHALSYHVNGRQLQERTRRRYLEEQDG
jgi:hypothetical protein